MTGDPEFPQLEYRDLVVWHSLKRLLEDNCDRSRERLMDALGRSEDKTTVQIIQSVFRTHDENQKIVELDRDDLSNGVGIFGKRSGGAA